MPNALNNIKDKIPVQKMRYLGACLWQEIVGVAQDYWKDGHWEKAGEDEALSAMDRPPSATPISFFERLKNSPFARKAANHGLWHAAPGEIAQKLWNGALFPGEDYIIDRLIRPLGLTNQMSLLDLSAGLGTHLRKTVKATGVYVTSLEPDPEIAERAKKVGVGFYDPKSLIVDRSYDCIILRESLYRIADKPVFVKTLGSACKPRAQLSFTDYIVDAEVRDKPAIAAWRGVEKDAKPVGLVEMAELWAKVGFELRVDDDQTDFYKDEIKKGLVRFIQFMSSGPQPDAATKTEIKKTIMLWAARMSAIDQGMRFYRFYGIR